MNLKRIYVREIYFHEYNFDDFNIEDKFNYKMKDCDYIIVDVYIGIKEENKKEIQCLEFILSNGISDNVYIEEKILLNCSRDMLSLIHFSFNNARETDLKNLKQLAFKHIKLVQEAVDSSNVDYLKEIMINYFQNSRILYFESCDESNSEIAFNKNNIKTIDDIIKVLNCYNKRYDSIKTIFKGNNK